MEDTCKKLVRKEERTLLSIFDSSNIERAAAFPSFSMDRVYTVV
jgi:hypothetical protein